jgi:glycosyltransferase involved in cell wall biosynthesis
MRLCLIVESGTDVRLVEGLAERFDLSILARRIVGGVEISQTPREPVDCLIGPASRSGFARFVWQQLRKRRDEFDAVLVQGYGMAALAANLAGRVNGMPTFMLVCSPAEAYYKCRLQHEEPGKPFRRRELWGLTGLARVNAVLGQRYIVLSNHLRDVVSRHGRGTKPIDVIPIYGVESATFSPGNESRNAIKARLGLPATGSLVFFSSRVAPEKDSETLLKAMRLLFDKGRDLWLLHRSGGYLGFIQDAERFGVADRVIATDAVHPHDALPDDYRACDVCVQASREEGLGFSPLEALACELPVIATAVGGLKETIVDGQTGWTYPVGDAVALAAQIEEALDNPAEAARRAVAGRAMVCDKYEREFVFQQLENLLARTSESQTESEKVNAS